MPQKLVEAGVQPSSTRVFEYRLHTISLATTLKANDSFFDIAAYGLLCQELRWVLDVICFDCVFWG